MRKLMNKIDRFCYTHPRFGIPNLMLYIVIGNIAFYLLSLFSTLDGGSFYSILSFSWAGLKQGQLWRLLSFSFLPTDTRPFWLLVSCYFYYWIGSTLERQWGTAKFTTYYLSGMLLTVIGASIVSLITGYSIPVYGANYVNFAMFMAFALLYPDTQVLFMFIIPIRMKWLAYLDIFYFFFDIFRYISSGVWYYAILPVVALGISSFVMLSTESLLSISFSSSLARYGGDVAVGAMTVITSASQLCTLPIQGVCQGGQPVMSFNFGAGKKDRVKQAFRFQLTLCLSYTTIFWLLMMLVPGAVAGIFTSDASLIDYTTWAMRIYMAGIFSTGVQIACQQSFMALGQAKVSLLLACLRKLILLIPLIFILPHVVANPVFGVFLAEPVSDIIAATVTATTFFLQFNKILDKGAGRV